MFFSPSKRVFASAVLVASTLMTATPCSRGDDFWRTAKDYTASIYKAAADAAAALKAAQSDLSRAQSALGAANAALAAAGASSNATLAAAATAAAGEVAAASAAVAAAAEALAAASACVAAFLAGTAVGQGADWLISWCWDPICPYDANNTFYVAPTDQELDNWTLQMFNAGAMMPVTMTDIQNADHAVPGSGTASWNYVREAARTFAIAARGAAAFSAGHCQDVLAARADLEAQFPRYENAITQYGSFLSSMRTYNNNAMQNLQSATQRVSQINPSGYNNPAAMQNAKNQCMAALSQCMQSLNVVSTANQGRPLEGPNGWVASLSVSDFTNFINDCRTRGENALPPAERNCVTQLMNSLQITPRGGGTILPSIAAWDALGDTGHEIPLFGTSGVLTPSQVLTSAIPNHWQRINLASSPLVISCSRPPCIADVDDGSGTGTPDGGVTIDDLLYYLGLFASGDVHADVDDGSGTGSVDGGVTIDDLLYYLFRFSQGC